MKMDDILIINIPPSGIGGSQTYAKLLKKNIEELDFKVFQIKTYSVKYNWLMPKELLLKTMYIFINLIKLSNILKRDDKKIVHLHLGDKFSFWENSLYALTCTIHNIPFIFHIHTNLIYSEYSNSTWFGKKIRDYIFAKSSRIIVLSNNLKKMLSRIESFPICKTVIVHNFIDVNRFNKYDKSEARKICKLPTNKKIIFGLGRLTKEKNFTSLILSINRICKKRDDIYCIIGGSGSEENKLRSLIKSKKLEDVVKLLGEVDSKNVPIFMSSCDVLVMPSFTEAFPMVVLESLASGRPVIGAKVGAIPEILSSEEYGLLVDPNEMGDITNKILLSLDTKWDDIKIINYCKEFYSTDVTNKIVRIYLNVLNIKKYKKLQL